MTRDHHGDTEWSPRWTWGVWLQVGHTGDGSCAVQHRLAAPSSLPRRPWGAQREPPFAGIGASPSPA